MEKNNSWLEVTLTVSPELSEVCGSLIFEEIGQGSFLEEKPLETLESSRLKVYVPNDHQARDQLIKLKKRINSLYRHLPDFPPPLWDLRLIFEENWRENWKRFFKPLRVCTGIVVCPTWEEYEPREGERILKLDPGQAFGTGGHASTRLCLKALETLDERVEEKSFLFSRVLDVGTGSGILALTAALLGAESVLAIDNDPLAVEAARNHVDLNGLEQTIQVELATPETVKGPFSLILANLTLNDLLPLTPVFQRLLQPGGILVTSGVLSDQVSALIKGIGRRQLVFFRQELDEEWACVLFQAREK
jgi:ribosomal protein L11 methyltransferase